MTNQTETKRQSAIEAEVIRDSSGMARELRLVFANGEALRIHEGMLTPELKAEALIHGLKQKLVDAAAISRNPDTGKSATVNDKFNAVMEVYNRLTVDAEWNAKREGSGQSSLLQAAMVEFSGKDAATVKTWLDGKTDAEKKALSLNPKVAAIINRIRAERAKTDGVDSDALLSELA